MKQILTSLKNFNHFTHFTILSAILFKLSLTVLALDFFKLLQFILQFFKIFIMKFSLLHIFFKEQINENSLIKLKFRIILNQFLVNEIIVNSIELEHENIWRSAYPCFNYFLLALLVPFKIFDFILSTSFPTLIQLISFL